MTGADAGGALGARGSRIGVFGDVAQRQERSHADGQPVTWEEYQARILAATGKPALTLNFPSMVLDIAAAGGELMTRIDKKPRIFNRQKVIMGKQAAWTCRHDRAEADFGYTPRVSLDEGVQRTLAWYREKRWV
jgi:nucleoside-diphosphate-sugar epimerase